MNCLLIAATAMEISPFLSYLPKGKKIFRTTDVLITGIGLTATTYSLMRQIRLKRPDLIIQAGIAGSFNAGTALGKVFVVRQDTIADMGVFEQESWKNIFDLSLAKTNDYPYSRGWLINKNRRLNDIGLEKVSAVSVNEISSSAHKIEMIAKKYKPELESMEGAALHYVGIMEKIPFLQLRSISNYAGDRNKKKLGIR